MKATLVVGIAFAFALGVLVILVFGRFYVPCTKSNNAECAHRIAEIYRILEIIAIDRKCTNLWEVFDRHPQEDAHDSLGRAVQYAMQESLIALPSYIQMQQDFAIMDPWGRPFNICWSDDSAPSEWGGGGHRNFFPLCIWSSGENGRNEYGGNDDVSVDMGSLPDYRGIQVWSKNTDKDRLGGPGVTNKPPIKPAGLSGRASDRGETKLEKR